MANLTMGSPSAQDAIVKEGALPLLVAMLSAGSPAAQEQAAVAIANMVGDAPKLQQAVAEAGAVMPLVMMLNWGTTAARAQAAVALGKLAHKNKANRDLIIENEAVPALVQILASKTEGGKTTANGAKDGNVKGAAGKVDVAACLAGLLAGDTQLQAILVEDGGLLPITALLKEKSTADAGKQLLAVFSDCFDDVIAKAK